MMLGYGMGFGLVSLLFGFLFLVGLIFLGIWLVNSLSGNRGIFSQPAAAQGPTAKEILDQRYARGEISREQYDQMKRDLG